MFRTKIIYKLLLNFMIFSIALLVPLTLSLNKALNDLFRSEERLEQKYVPPENLGSFDDIHNDFRKEIYRHLLSISFYSFFVAFLLSLFMTRRFSRSLQSLHEGAERVRDGNLDETVPVYSDDEIGEVTRVFNDMIKSLKNKTEELEKKDLYVKNMMDALWVVDEDNRIIDINPAFTKLLGYEKGDVIGSSIYDYVDDENARRLEFELETKRAAGRPSTYELSMIAKDGTYVPVLITGAPVIRDGETISKIGIIKDFREQAKLLKELSESKDHLETIMNSIQDTMLIIDRQYNIVRANTASYKKYGYDIIGKKCHVVSHMGSQPCWLDGEDCPLQHVFSESEVFRIIHEHYDETGRKRYEEIVASPISDADGNVVEVIEFLRDITERKLYEDKIDKRNRELLLLNFIATIIHRSLKAKEVFIATLDKLIEMLNMDGGEFFLLDENKRVLNCLYHRGIAEEFVREAGRVKLGDDIPGRVALTGELIATSDISTDRRISHSMLKHSGIKGYCCIPVKGKERIVGVFCLFRFKEHHFSEDDVRILRSVGEMTGLALENIRLYEKMREMFQTQKNRREQEQKSLLELSSYLAAATDMDEVIRFASELIKDFLKSDILLFWEKHDSTELILRHSMGIELKDNIIAPGSSYPEIYCIDNLTYAIVKDITSESRFAHPNEFFDEGIHSILSFPVLVGDRCLGVFTIASKVMRDFREDEIHFLRIITSIFGVAHERSNLYEKRIIDRGLAEAILNTISEGVCTVNSEGLITSANRSAERILGYKATQLIGRNYLTIFNDWEGGECPVFLALNGKQASGEVTVHHDGIESVLHFNSLPLIDTQGRVYGAVQVIRDITREKEVSRLKTDLIRSVSHEFRTPLSAILGLTEMLMDHVVTGEKADRYLQTIYDEGLRLSDMVSDLLDISRIESGKVKLKEEEIDLRSIFKSLSENFQKRLSERSISLNMHIPDNTRLLTGDSERIRQLLSNLIDNSIKYSDPESSIDISVRKDLDYVIMKIVDTGWGISPKDLPHIGERFYRGKHGAKTKGTGLGLSLCKEIVEMHDGRLKIESEPGKGTRITIYLPSRRKHNGESDGN